MSPPSWDTVQDLFLGALEIDTGMRVDWVREAASDAETARQVLALLAAHEGTSPFDALTRKQDAVDEDDVHRGSVIGSWEVVGEIGHGGMGTVYEVRRRGAAFEQTGALKVLSRGLLSPGVEARFAAERQLLADLRHPGIAAVLDGGVHGDGRPWFVMELVEGNPIDHHCNQRRLDTQARLRLFLHVCAAVQHAHQALVVHRDIKPSNILVSVEGDPKLLDFGIAKLVGGAHDGGATVTRAYTPGHASPEQVLGRSVTTASDVYQLGILLHGLLVGLPPRLDDRGEPAAPSRALEGGTESDAAARARGATIDRLRRELKGDLDAIVTKALRPEPGRRYGTAGELAEDVRRHLDRRPVLARPDSVAYRAGRFVRRNAVGVAGVAGSFLAVLGFAIGEGRQARLTAAERDRAEDVVDFLVGLFATADPRFSPADTLRVTAVLERGAERALEQPADQPLVQATLLESIASAFDGLGLYRRAAELQEQALGRRAMTDAPDATVLARGRRALIRYAAYASDLVALDSLLPGVEAELRRTERPGTVPFEVGIGEIGFAWLARGDAERAEPLLEEATTALRRMTGVDDHLAIVLNNLGQLRLARGDPDSAVVLMREGLELRRRGDPDGARLATTLETLADALLEVGDLEGAGAALEEALGHRRRTLPAGHPLLGGALKIQGDLFRRTGRRTEAIARYRDALAIRLDALGADHYVVGEAQNALAIALEEQGELAEAEELYRTALATYAAHFGSDHPNAVAVESNLARLLLRTGALVEARDRFEHALPITRATWPANAGYMGDVVSLGVAYCRTGAHPRADSVLSEGVEILRPPEGAPPSDGYLRALNAHGSCRWLAGDPDRGERILSESLQASSDRPDSDPYRAFALQTLRAMGRPPG